MNNPNDITMNGGNTSFYEDMVNLTPGVLFENQYYIQQTNLIFNEGFLLHKGVQSNNWFNSVAS